MSAEPRKPWLLPRRITWRVCLVIILVFLLSTGMVLLIGERVGLEVARKYEGEKLRLAAQLLDSRLQESFAEILARAGASQEPAAIRAALLRRELDPLLGEVAVYYPGYSLGYYSLELGGVVAQTDSGPDPVRGIPSAEFLRVYQTGKPELLLYPGQVVWGRVVLCQVYPIVREGVLIGHVWASTDLNAALAEIRRHILPPLLAVVLVLEGILVLVWYQFRALNRWLRICVADIVSGAAPRALPAFPELEPVMAAFHEYAARLQSACAEQQAANALFDTAFNSSPSMMAIIRRDDATCLEVNRSFLLTLGYTREEVIGSRADDLRIIMEPVATLIRARVANLVDTREPLQNQEVVFRTKDGRLRTGLLSVEPIRVNGEGCLLIVVADITERKEMEAAMARLDRLNLVGELAAGISHEVRNPMTTIRGFLQLLSSKPGCQPYRNYYDLMIEELDRANSIITEFLQLGRNQIGQYKQANLNSVVEALIPLIKADAMGADKSVWTSLEPVPELWLNEKEIRQIILNLARNGLEAMAPGGCLNVKTFVDGLSGEIVLSIQDRGPGIPPEILEKLGTPFFTTKEKGTGLGLAVCYSIAARHRARIEIDSGTSGTSVNVRFNPGSGAAGENDTMTNEG